MHVRPSGRYCPFDIETDLSRIGFTAVDTPTEFGALRLYSQRSNDLGRASLLIHGVAADSTTWSPLLRAVADSGWALGNVVLVDLPGFGASENRRQRMPIPEVGRAVLEAVSDLGFSEVDLVGHSMGGFLALDMAARWAATNPGMSVVRSVTVFAGSYFAILNTIKHPLANLKVNARTGLLWNAYATLCRTGAVGQFVVSSLTDLGLAQALSAPFVAHPLALRRQVAETLMRQLNPSGVLQTAANGPTYDAVSTWGSIRLPLRAVFASRDSMVTSWDERELLNCNPLASTSWVRDAGHMMIVERPFECLAASQLSSTIGTPR